MGFEFVSAVSYFLDIIIFRDREQWFVLCMLIKSLFLFQLKQGVGLGFSLSKTTL